MLYKGREKGNKTPKYRLHFCHERLFSLLVSLFPCFIKSCRRLYSALFHMLTHRTHSQFPLEFSES